MEVYFCDLCRDKIILDKFELTIFDVEKEEDVISLDLCKKCKEVIEGDINNRKIK